MAVYIYMYTLSYLYCENTVQFTQRWPIMIQTRTVVFFSDDRNFTELREIFEKTPLSKRSQNYGNYSLVLYVLF